MNPKHSYELKRGEPTMSSPRFCLACFAETERVYKADHGEPLNANELGFRVVDELYAAVSVNCTHTDWERFGGSQPEANERAIPVDLDFK